MHWSIALDIQFYKYDKLPVACAIGSFCTLNKNKNLTFVRKNEKYGLTKGLGWYTMVFHNVLLCPNRPSFPTWTWYHILAGLSSVKLNKITTAPCVL